MEATFRNYILKFKQASGTSRGILHAKETFILELSDNGRKGTGECALFRGLSSDDVSGYESKLQWLCDNINLPEAVLHEELRRYPSIWIGYEQAVLNLKHGNALYFPSAFTDRKQFITINGLIWMGDRHFMEAQITEKLKLGFGCIKLKIGTDWPAEREVLQQLREVFPATKLELRVDANGAFTAKNVTGILEDLARLGVHSIEQPIRAGHVAEMAELCRYTPVPIALDEELIGIHQREDKIKLLEAIQPQYIILKPSLCGGFSGSDEWIDAATALGIGWWITSALESNIGLNAIAQYTFTKNPEMPQGLGTGALFVNNFESQLTLDSDRLYFK